MHLVAPDLLQEAQGLSIVPCAVGITLGLALWLFGWRMHRFWLVLTATLSAGIFGLQFGPSQGVQPLVAGLLLGIAAGALVLDVIRVIAFAAGAVTFALLAQQFIPAWKEPFVFCFLGGFLGLVLLRYWMMALFSFIGAVLVLHSGLCLVDTLGKMDSVAWSQKKRLMLDVIAGVSTAVGFMIQFYLDRKRKKKGRKDKGNVVDLDSAILLDEPKPRRNWWKLWKWWKRGKRGKRADFEIPDVEEKAPKKKKKAA